MLDVAKVLVIGAHPDDIELGCGGFLSRIKQQSDIVLVTLSKGELGGKPKEREQECINSAGILGAGYAIYDFPDGNFILDQKIIKVIENIVDKFKPTLILTHHETDFHHDHKVVYQATMEAARNELAILSYEDSVSKYFRPNLFIDITGFIENKLKLVQCFASQRDKFFIQQQSVRSLALVRANQMRGNMTYVEAYQVEKLAF